MPIERGSKVQEIWKRNDVLTRVLVEYMQINRIKRVFDLIARSDYRELIDWDFVANATGAEVLHCFSVMGGGEDALLPFAKFVKNFALEATDEKLLAINPETELEGVLIRDVPYTRKDLPTEWREIIQQSKKEVASPPISVAEIPDELGIGQPSDIKTSGDWLISFTDSFRKSLLQIGDKKIEGRILEAVAWLSQNPTKVIGDTNIPLKGKPVKGIWRYRLGKHRILHLPDNEKQVILLISIDTRETAYEAFSIAHC
jgi:mRNA-degrading endonuclease RelE of RelBE toxin-antitoxin system